MSVLANFVFLAMCVLHTKGQDCADYNVTASLMANINFDGNDVELKCTYSDNPNVESIAWQTKNNSGDTFRAAYTYYTGFDPFSPPEFVGRLGGDRTSDGHILTILKANSTDHLNIWNCIVNTLTCVNTNEDSLILNLTEPWIVDTILDAKGTVTEEEPDDIQRDSREEVIVTCYALSYIDITLSITGVEDESSQECDRVVGPPPQPLNCSVTGKMPNPFLSLKYSKNVYCEAKGTESPIKQPGISSEGDSFNATYRTTYQGFKIRMIYSGLEIFVIILLIVVCVALTGVVARFLILYCCLKWCREMDFCHPVCIRVCCMPSDNKA